MCAAVIIKQVITKVDPAAAAGSSAIGQWTITDGTACVGGNTINFATHFKAVHAVEIDPRRVRPPQLHF